LKFGCFCSVIVAKRFCRMSWKVAFEAFVVVSAFFFATAFAVSWKDCGELIRFFTSEIVTDVRYIYGSLDNSNIIATSLANGLQKI